jgi:predicted nucleotidyltransferase
MNPLAQGLVRISSDLRDLNAPWALVGGLAVSVWAEPRLTRDIDLAVAAESDRDSERLVRDLGERGYRAADVIEHEPTGRLATARLSHGQLGPVVIDLLFASSGIEKEIVQDAVRIEVFEGLRIPVAARPHLIALKVLARDDRLRPQDYDDLLALTRRASPVELAHATRLLALIEKRGYARRRDLAVAFDRFLHQIRT